MWILSCWNWKVPIPNWTSFGNGLQYQTLCLDVDSTWNPERWQILIHAMCISSNWELTHLLLFHHAHNPTALRCLSNRQPTTQPSSFSSGHGGGEEGCRLGERRRHEAPPDGWFCRGRMGAYHQPLLTQSAVCLLHRCCAAARARARHMHDAPSLEWTGGGGEGKEACHGVLVEVARAMESRTCLRELRPEELTCMLLSNCPGHLPLASVFILFFFCWLWRSECGEEGDFWQLWSGRALNCGREHNQYAKYRLVLELISSRQFPGHPNIRILVHTIPILNSWHEYIHSNGVLKI